MSDTMTPDEARGAMIRARREMRGWSRARLAEETGLVRKTIANVESGRDCRVSVLRAIADALEVPRADRAMLVGWS